VEACAVVESTAETASTFLLKGAAMKSPVVKRSIVLAGHKTSVSLEEAFWQGLKEIARNRRATLSDVVSDLDIQRSEGNLSSTIRLFVLDHYRTQPPTVR
jgi:predicted DNA-binding ribbon-helix-helix protein